MKEKMQTAIDFLRQHKEVVAVALCIVIALATCAYVDKTIQTRKVTTETQTQAQTESGVEKAADNAHVPINREQAQTAANEISHIYETHEKPEYTIVVPSMQMKKEADRQRELNHADFAIITPENVDSDSETAKNGTKSPNSTISPSENDNVELNQYNIHAYKKVLRTIEVSPNIDGSKGAGQAGFSVSRKVTNDGKYLGVGADYNFDNHRTYLKVNYTW